MVGVAENVEKLVVYNPSLSQLKKYGSSHLSCGCGSSVRGGRICKHMVAVKKILLLEVPMWDATLSHHGRVYCGCVDWVASGECVHVWALERRQDEWVEVGV